MVGVAAVLVLAGGSAARAPTVVVVLTACHQRLAADASLLASLTIKMASMVPIMRRASTATLSQFPVMSSLCSEENLAEALPTTAEAIQKPHHNPINTDLDE